jgi:LuxR family transcriptional regulator, maltose regulon positive regulatory protein
MALAQYTSGDLQAPERSLTDLHTNLRKAGEIPTLIGITFLLADIKVALGRLHEARSNYQQVLQLVTKQGEPIPVGTADLYRGLGELYCEQGDLETAAQLLQTGKKVGEQAVLTGWQQRLCVAEARIREARGNLEEAIDLLEEAERLFIRSPLPDVRPVAALKARVWLKQGRLAEAMRWAQEQGPAVDEDTGYTREFEHITLARVLIAAGQSEQEAGTLEAATRLLGRLLQAAETGGRMGSAIQILLLQALAFQAQDNHPQALSALGRALALAEPEGYVRIFVDEGEEMRMLISDYRFSIEKQKSRNAHTQLRYAGKLLATFPAPDNQHSTIKNPNSEMIEPLSERELEVLKLLRSELNGPEIAQQLIVSLNTLRTHTKNIYNKLGVNNRRAAIQRGEELGLF